MLGKLPDRALGIFRRGELYDPEETGEYSVERVNKDHVPASLGHTGGGDKYFGKQNLSS